ncbi:MAG TPA: molybdopterin-dependent oxidoreductase, partial [Chloroflexota bacterium]|nr:molybdopterin-dependent oxidoreductase [Chloroflexota bacterium]
KNLVDPVVDVKSWQLSVAGLVDHPLDLSYQDVLAFPAVDAVRTLECISNEVGGDLMSNGRWTGLRLADVLHKVGVQSGASELQFTCVDGYTESMPMTKAMDPQTLLVYHLNGQPLPSKHGYPVRVLGTGTYGMKNPKWLNKIQIARTAQPGFWVAQGWSPDAIVQTMSKITTPTPDASVHVGPVTVGGVAFAGSRGIRQVEVSTDGGTSWQPAKLVSALGPFTWVLWEYNWQPTKPGKYTLVVRATDGTGVVQATRETDTFPDGATGYQRVDVPVSA